jgi:hypothetical protein
VSKNRVPSTPTPAIDAAMEKYRRLLREAGYDDADVGGVEAGLEAFAPPFNGGFPGEFRGRPIVWIEATYPEARPQFVLSAGEA